MHLDSRLVVHEAWIFPLYVEVKGEVVYDLTQHL